MLRFLFILMILVMACSGKEEKLKQLVKEEAFFKSEINRLDSMKDFNVAMIISSQSAKGLSPKSHTELNDSLQAIFDSRYKIERIQLNQQLDSIRREIALLSPDAID